MLFRTRKVRKKYAKLHKEYRESFLNKIRRRRLRNWHVFHKLKKIKNFSDNSYSYLLLNNFNQNFLFSKNNNYNLQSNFNLSTQLSSEHCLLFKNFINNKCIFYNYDKFYQKPNEFSLNQDILFNSSNFFFLFLVSKSKVYDLIYIFKYFKNYYIINFKSNDCYLIYHLSGEFNMFFLFYSLYVRFVFFNNYFLDVIFQDLNYFDFWCFFEQYFILNQFYCFMSKYKNLENFNISSNNITLMDYWNDLTFSEKLKEDTEAKLEFEEFKLDESENMQLSNYILYDKYDFLNIFNTFFFNDLQKDQFTFSEDDLCPFIILDKDYLDSSLNILNHCSTLFNNFLCLEK